MKPKIGFFDLSGCNGCVLSVVFNEDELVDIAANIDLSSFRLVQKKDAKYDIAFIEGLVADKADLDRLKKIRADSKLVVAFGTCAATGNIPALRNYMPNAKYAQMVYERRADLKDEQPVPIHHHIKVDYTLPGCPPDRDEIKTFIKDLLLGKTYHDHDKPVCDECRHNENRCLLIEDGKPCMGPITKGGCNAICINGGLECWGCRGLTPDANTDMWTKSLIEKGYTKAQVEKRMKSFIATELSEIPKADLPKPRPLPKVAEKKAVPKPKPVKKAVKKIIKKPAKKVVKKPVKQKLVKKRVKAAKKVKRLVKKPAKKVVKKKSKKTIKKRVKAAKKTKRPVKKPVKKVVKKSKKTIKPAKVAKKTKRPVKKAVKQTAKKTPAKKRVAKKPTGFFDKLKKKLTRK